MQSFVILCLLAGTASSFIINRAKEMCDRLCSNCGGIGLIKENVCECLVQIKDQSTLDCMEAQTKSIGYFGNTQKTLVKSKGVESMELDHQIMQRTRRMPRRAQFYDLGFGGFSPEWSGFRYQRNYRPDEDDYMDSHMYEIFMGDDDEQRLQFVFPDSNGIEVEHQYLYEDENGDEYPISGPVKEPPFPRKDTYLGSGRNTDDDFKKNNWKGSGGNLWTYNGEKAVNPPTKWEVSEYMTNGI